MALETLKGKTQTPSGVSIINMGDLRDTNPDLFPDGGMQMDYKVFEETIRPYNYIYVRDDVNSVSFTIQNGPIKENGKNGCQVTQLIEVAKMILDGLNEKFPCMENEATVNHLEQALWYQEKRTKDREGRGVEGHNKP